jgi:hypothetical protein
LLEVERLDDCFFIDIQQNHILFWQALKNGFISGISLPATQLVSMNLVLTADTSCKASTDDIRAMIVNSFKEAGKEALSLIKVIGRGV